VICNEEDTDGRARVTRNEERVIVIERVEKLNIIIITVSHMLTFHHHISALITKCSRSLYAVKTICAHGLYGNTLRNIHLTRSTLFSQLQYTRSAWWGYLKADEGNRLQPIVSKAIRYGNLPCSFSTLDELREDADKQLLIFSSRYNSNLVLHRCLLQPKNTDYNFRQRTHNLIDVDAVIKRNSVYRMLFRDMYWFYRTLSVIQVTSFTYRHLLILA